MNLSPQALLRTIDRDVVLRGALVSAAATLFALILLALAVWAFLVQRLEQRVEQALVTRHEVAVSNAIEMTDKEREVVRRFRLSLPIRDEGVFAWLDSDGVAYASNVKGLDCREGFYDGWLDVSGESGADRMPRFAQSTEDSAVSERFLFLSRDREQGCLVFGRSLFEIDALRTSFRGLLVWLIPLCLLPALVIGLFQSFRLRKRLRGFGSVVQAVSRGDLDARIPIEGGDDIDRLARWTNRSFDRLQDSVGTLQQLTSVMAHDLRAPLSRVAVPLDEAVRDAQGGTANLASLEEVQDGLADVRSVFDALLRISQIESGRRRANFKAVDLFELAEGLFEIYQPVIEDDGRTLELEILGTGSSTILGDRELIQQAAVNLIENAARYSPSGALIRLGVQRGSSHPVFFVRDNGPGIPDSERPRVLRRLYRYEQSTGGRSGHGLGLSLVKAVADLHDARLSLEDADPGLLATLTFKSQV